LNIDYATPPPTFAAHSKTLYGPDTQGLTAPGRPGNYTLIVSISGPGYDDANGNCTIEVRPNPAGFNYTEGVMAGDWVKYDISAFWIGSGVEPSSVTEFRQMEWLMVRFESGESLNTTTHFRNGTEQLWGENGLNWDGNSFSPPDPSPGWLRFPSSLKKGDTFQLYAWPLSLQYFIPFDFPPPVVDVAINDTITRNYAGSSRSVNVLSLTSSNGGFEGGTVYWDQKSGVLLEFVWRASLAGGTVQWSYKISDTKIWKP
jgi:hypothetical protein